MNLETLRAALAKAVGALEEFEAGLVDENGEPRDLTEKEIDKMAEMTAVIEKAAKAVTVKENADRARAANAVAADGNRGTVPATPKAEPEQFKSFGEFLMAVASDGINKGDMSARDRRLVYQRTPSGANESTPAEGGFLVQTDHSTALLDLMHEMGEIVNRVRRIPISSNANGIKLPLIDETSRARGSRFGGVRSYWAAEGDTVTDSKPKFGEIELRLNKLMSIGYATEELLADATALEAIMSRAFAEEMAFEVEDAVINGNGAGKPLGILNSGALVSVAAESGQATGTFVVENVLKMWDRLPIRSRRNAVWLSADSQIEPQLSQLTLSGSGAHIYKPAGMNAATPANEVFGTLLGRPVVPVEYLPGLGTIGDLMLVDLDQYLMIDKGGVAQAQSMHVRFLYDEMTYKVTYRVDGQPAWRTPVTTANGATTKSPFIALATR